MRVGFGEFRFDGETRRLERRGEEVHLTPKAFRLLEILLEGRPRALSKEKLCDRLWPDVIVDPGNLTNLIAEIRGAIAAAGGDPAVIRTARRFGYAFDGETFSRSDDDSARSAAALFFLVSGESRTRLREGVNLLGRGADCVVSLASPNVSRHHARIVIAERTATLEDLGSRNGTFVGETRVTNRVELHAGDRVLLGATLAGTFEIVSVDQSTVTEAR